MIEILTGFPDDVLAVTGTGNITAEDYRNVLIPAATKKVKKHTHVNIFCHLGIDFRSFAPDAMWEDTKLLVGHWGEWGRIAVVTDRWWIAEAMRMFVPFFHHPIRVFPNDNLADAKRWIVEREAKPA